MSAFVGLLILDGTPCPPSVVEAMLGRLRHRVDARGWSGAQVRCQNCVGLGYAPSLSTPESLGELQRPDEAQTLTHQGLTLWLTSDVRLDGRDDLIRELGLPSEAKQWSDGRLILEAYARWGRDAPAHLRGDFAFGIWDAARERLFCARDRFGTKPFYYAYKPGQFFAFSNEIKALWPVPGLDAAINETQVVNYLLSRFDDKTSTFYAAVRRLSPAHWFEVAPKQRDELQENRYWQLDAARELALPRDGDYAAMLREGFVASVRERMRSADKFAVFLSGGLDSSSVAAVAERYAEPSQKPVPALSRVFDRFSECDERPFIQATLDRGEFQPIWRVSDDLTALTDIEKMLWHLDQPSPGPNSCAAWAQYRVLQDAGASVVIDGHGGDEVVFKGYERVSQLLRQGQYATAWHEITALRRHGIMEEGPGPLVWNALLWRARGTKGIGRVLSLRTRGKSRSQSTLGASPADSGVQSGNQALRLLSPRFVGQAQHSPAATAAHSVREEHFKALESAVQPVALEMLDSMAGAHAMESRCPFWEQELIEMCLSFPADQKMRHGFNRYVMRGAMEGLLAPKVQWRPDKTDFSAQVLESLRVAERERIDQMLDLWTAQNTRLSEFVELGEVRLLWEQVQSVPPGSPKAMQNASILWKVLNLGLWLSQSPKI